MAYRFETEEDEETGRRGRTLGRKGRGAREEDDSGAEITLGTRSLLGIFFGLVLICAIFFGLGYSVGRGSGSKAALAAASPEVAPLPAESTASKPSPQLAPAPEAQGADAGAGSGSPQESAPALEPAAALAGPGNGSGAGASAPAASGAGAVVKPAGFPSEEPGANPAVLKPAIASAAAPGGIMVQVAAISIAQDADILVGALKKRGYTAVIRNEPQDKLLHVQLGPFATRAEASAMRTKLLADGYNAVVK